MVNTVQLQNLFESFRKLITDTILFSICHQILGIMYQIPKDKETKTHINNKLRTIIFIGQTIKKTVYIATCNHFTMYH